MKAYNHEFRSGMKQGEIDRLCGCVVKACPYTHSKLQKYKAWVRGWHYSFFKSAEVLK